MPLTVLGIETSCDETSVAVVVREPGLFDEAASSATWRQRLSVPRAGAGPAAAMKGSTMRPTVAERARRARPRAATTAIGRTDIASRPLPPRTSVQGRVYTRTVNRLSGESSLYLIGLDGDDCNGGQPSEKVELDDTLDAVVGELEGGKARGKGEC